MYVVIEKRMPKYKYVHLGSSYITEVHTIILIPLNFIRYVFYN